MMNFFVIILSLILFHGYDIYGLGNQELATVDVLEKLKADAPNCELRGFVQSKKDYEELSADLKQFCSSIQDKKYTLLCNMLYYEIKRACELPPASRPSPGLYDIQTTATDICNIKRIELTNDWILNKITNNGEIQIAATKKDLCKTVTSDASALRLARFFYKRAARVRQADLLKRGKDFKKTS